ncbi:unnamed protein product, partial [Staurois parvus]
VTFLCGIPGNTEDGDISLVGSHDWIHLDPCVLLILPLLHGEIDSDTLTPYRNLTHTMIQSPSRHIPCLLLENVPEFPAPLTSHLSAAPSSSW